MSLSKAERLILANQYKILALLEPSKSQDHELNQKIIEFGCEGLYYEPFINLRDKEISQNIFNEVIDILKMHLVINNVANGEKIKDFDKIKFKGFDANHDDHYDVMDFMVKNLDTYQEYKGTKYNSHDIFSLDKYKKLLDLYQKAIKSSSDGTLNLDALKKIISDFSTP